MQGEKTLNLKEEGRDIKRPGAISSKSLITTIRQHRKVDTIIIASTRNTAFLWLNLRTAKFDPKGWTVHHGYPKANQKIRTGKFQPFQLT